jgi:hypothetical protein
MSIAFTSQTQIPFSEEMMKTQNHYQKLGTAGNIDALFAVFFETGEDDVAYLRDFAKVRALIYTYLYG